MTEERENTIELRFPVCLSDSDLEEIGKASSTLLHKPTPINGVMKVTIEYYIEDEAEDE